LIVENIPAFVILSVLIFFGYKFTFWANAFILLSAMQRNIKREFWKFSPVELITSSIASISFSHAILFNEDRFFVPIIFTLSSLTYLFYIINRVWRLSMKREPS